MDSTQVFKLQELGVFHSPRMVDGSLVFKINFKNAQDKCPELMEVLVLSVLTEIEAYYYKNGYMAYIVQNTGDLQWKRTPKAL